MTLKTHFDSFIGDRLSCKSDESIDNLTTMRQNLLNILNDAQKILLKDYEDAYSCLNGQREFQAYVQGFVDGVRISGGFNS